MYQVFRIPKKSGGFREIQAPDARLKKLQRMLLQKLYRENAWIISENAHGFLPGRSIKSNAEPHLGKRFLLNIDLADFFPSCKSYMLDKDLLSLKHAGMVFWEGRLPTGAPTSPFLANLIMQRFDDEIVDVLRKAISDDIVYTRYADDLTFSSNSRAIHGKAAMRLIRKSLLMYCGKTISVNDAKTRRLTRSMPMEITGIMVNSGKPTISAQYRKKVRAVVHRVSQGWPIQEDCLDRLQGMIAHIALCHPAEAARYREQISHARVFAKKSRNLSGHPVVYLPGRKDLCCLPEVSDDRRPEQTGRSRRLVID